MVGLGISEASTCCGKVLSLPSCLAGAMLVSGKVYVYIYTVKANYIITAHDSEIRRMTEKMIYPSNRICHK